MPRFSPDDHKVSNEFGAYVLSTGQQALNSCGRFDGSAARKPQNYGRMRCPWAARDWIGHS